MPWILLEGADRSGKSTAADYYVKELGYEYVHMLAPDKKYFKPGYTGPSYFDECLDMYQMYDGANVVFDRTIYGELIWPQVFNRRSQLNEEQLEILREYEDANESTRLHFHDPDYEAHWGRIVLFKEKLTRAQFNLAISLYEKLARAHNFTSVTMHSFLESVGKNTTKDDKSPQIPVTLSTPIVDPTLPTLPTTQTAETKTSPVQDKLAKANAINDILSSRILKKKGELYDSLEAELRLFLEGKIEQILSPKKDDKSFTNEEVNILKTLAQRVIEKEKK